MLFGLVRAGRFSADDPATAARLGLDEVAPDALTPVEQDALPDAPLDDALAQIAWPDGVAGCALSQEIVVLPPSAEAELGMDPATEGAAARVAAHPERREARLVVGVLRDGSRAAVLRLRGSDSEDEVLAGPDLAPNLADALLATFA